METKENREETQLQELSFGQEKSEKICKMMLLFVIIFNPIIVWIFLGFITNIELFIFSVSLLSSYISSLFPILFIYRLIGIPLHSLYLKNKGLLEEKCFKKIISAWGMPIILLLLLGGGCIIIFYALYGIH